MLIFRGFFKTQSDQNIYQNAPHCTKFSKLSHGASTGAYAGFLRGGPNFKISGILDIHAASSEAASLC